MPFAIDSNVVRNFFTPQLKTIQQLKLMQHGIRVSIEGTVKNVTHRN